MFVFKNFGREFPECPPGCGSSLGLLKKPQIFILPSKTCQRQSKTRAANVWDLVQSDQPRFK